MSNQQRDTQTKKERGYRIREKIIKNKQRLEKEGLRQKVNICRHMINKNTDRTQKNEKT